MLIGWSSRDKIRFSTLLLSRCIPEREFNRQSLSSLMQPIINLTGSHTRCHIKGTWGCTCTWWGDAPRKSNSSAIWVPAAPKTEWVTTCEWSEGMNHTRQFHKPAAWCFLSISSQNPWTLLARRRWGSIEVVHGTLRHHNTSHAEWKWMFLHQA